MASTVNFQRCNYLPSRSTPYVFASERAELVHINQQISSLDDHISQLNALRNTLHLRLYQLQNLLSPVHALPVEVLSSIFKQVIGSIGFSFLGPDPYRLCLRQALVLSSVTTHFRYVAFSTPELWKKIPLALHRTGPEATGKASALLQHCTALASNVDVSISDKLKLKRPVRSAIGVLLTPDTVRKIKAFRLYSSHAPKLWIDKLKASSFPMLDTLTLDCQPWKNVALDLGTLNNVTRLVIQNAAGSTVSSFIIPLSIRHLEIIDVPQQFFVSLLYHCPNLVECISTINYRYLLDGTKFAKPLTLNHLKRLTLDVMILLETGSSAQHFHLPSLEYLHFRRISGDQLPGVVSLCRNVSATLTTLKIHPISETLEYDDLCQLCRLPFPKLRELEFCPSRSGLRSSLLNVVRALTPPDVESDTSRSQMFPSLRYLYLGSSFHMEPHFLVDMLKKWRVGETSYFHLNVSYSWDADETWSPELREELRRAIHDRQIEVTWNRMKLL
jgi:hypothetical protein